ncbi:Rne/Rng family ribonuclease [Hugenholtzia roseola]|uniref:Rne/Rng family ribonuclease n=1 Tax=Hugenholtzia roseola TaxID=1002 RepID=UPI0003F4F715|nr:Rne/Rng family ribonuclease [Hugenholtzia roseola]
MSSELVINTTETGGRIALLRDRNLVEFHYDDSGKKFTVGDIILGTVRRTVPGLNAAFVDIGHEKDAFLHYLDLGPQFRSLSKYVQMVRLGQISDKLYTPKVLKEEPIDKLGKIGDLIKAGQPILVQIIKEPISTKGPRLAAHLSIAGRYLVLVPFDERVLVSRKITNKNERKRLQRLMDSVKPEGFGVIVRTVAENREIAELERDLQDLTQKWRVGMQKLEKARFNDKVIGEMNRANSILRDILNESFDSIIVDNDETYDTIKDFIRQIAPDKEKIVRYYTGRAKIFEAFGVEKQLKMLFGKTVSLPSGGYLVIEHTEALHVIDVNSGAKASREEDPEMTAIKVNLEAAREVARQLLLRDMGGIIVIDFIDMRSAENRKLLYSEMKRYMQRDRAKHAILPLSRFGVMQITRQRVRPELNIVTREICPTCDGTGKISATIGVADQIEERVEDLLTKQNSKGITIAMHPYLHAFFTKGLYSKQIRWFFKYFKWVKIQKDTSLALTQYHFYDHDGQEIEV